MTILPLSTAKNFIRPFAAHDADISLCNICYEWADGRRKDYEPPHGTREGVCTVKEVLQVLHGVGDLTLCVAWNKLL